MTLHEIQSASRSRLMDAADPLSKATEAEEREALTATQKEAKT